MPEDRDFTVDGERCAAWWFSPDGRLRGPGGVPAVAMAPGFGATRDCGFVAFAEQLAAAGVGVLLFDYRHFGASGGTPRQLLSAARQRADYRGALVSLRAFAEVDAARIGLWGVSYSGGHVVRVAAEDGRIAAVVALTPAPDGLATMRFTLAREGPVGMARLTVGSLLAGVRDAVGGLAGREPVLLPVFGPPGSVAAITAEGAQAAFARFAGPTWRNEVCARTMLEVGRNRPGLAADRVGCPLLVQVADLDSTAPPAAAMALARRAPGRARVRHYPCDHMDVYPGEAWHEAASAHAAEFLADVLAAPGD